MQAATAADTAQGAAIAARRLATERHPPNSHVPLARIHRHVVNTICGIGDNPPAESSLREQLGWLRAGAHDRCLAATDGRLWLRSRAVLDRRTSRGGDLLPLHPLPAPNRTGAQASARLQPGSSTVQSGDEHLRGWNAGSGLEKVFCGACGSAVFARDPADGEASIVRLGALDGDPGVRPSARQFVAYAAPWEDIPDDGLPRFDERLPV